jgi:hypothetical protein
MRFQTKKTVDPSQVDRLGSHALDTNQEQTDVPLPHDKGAILAYSAAKNVRILSSPRSNSFVDVAYDTRM